MFRSAFTVAATTLLALALASPAPAQRADETGDRNAQKQWAAVALGRVEPRSREIRLAAAITGRIIEVLVKPNDTVFAGELLVRLDNVEAHARVVMAEAQAQARERARDDQSSPRGSGARRRAEEALSEAEQVVFATRETLDAVVTARRSPGATADDAVLAAARERYGQAQERLRRTQGDLSRIKNTPGTPLPNRTEADWLAGRAELMIADAGLERTRIRAPIDGTVLQVAARPGEVATLTVDRPLVVLGDLGGLRVRAELDERDIGQVRVGQAVTVRANAFPGRDFRGSVTSIAQTVGPGGMTARGPRRQSDIDVLEVTVDLADPGPLKVGMQVDVYFGRDAGTPR